MLDSWGRLAPAVTSKGQGRRQSWWFTQLDNRNLQFCTVRTGCLLAACLASAGSAATTAFFSEKEKRNLLR